jgi:hypothetical protein
MSGQFLKNFRHRWGTDRARINTNTNAHPCSSVPHLWLKKFFSSPSSIEILEPRRLFSSGMTTLAMLPSGTALGGIVVDSQGDIFGVTQASTSTSTTTTTSTSSATVYVLPAGDSKTEALVGGAAGADLTIDSAGNVYDDNPTGGTAGTGSIFELSAGTETLQTLASYTGTDGSELGDGVVRDLAGDIFVLAEPGTAATGDGAILELPATPSHSSSSPPPNSGASALAFAAPTNSFTTLATFPSGADPSGQIAIDSAGDIFAVAAAGGANGDGAIYELPASDRSTINLIASFNTADPAPQGDLISDARGDLFGTTYEALTTQQSLSTVFELPHGSDTINVLDTDSTFTGSHIQPGLVRDSAGDIFGAIAQTSGPSTVFDIYAGQNSLHTLASASEIQSSGVNTNEINGPLAIDAQGNIYGTTTTPGTSPSTGTNSNSNSNSNDTLFELTATTTPDTANSLAIASQPKTAIASTPISISVAAIDTNGNVVSSDDSSITVSIVSSKGSLLLGTTTETPVDGIATFSNFELTTSGTYRLGFTQGTLTATSAPIKITPSPLDGSHLVISESSASVVAGNKIPLIEVTAENSADATSTTTTGKVTLTLDNTTGAPVSTKTASLKKGVASFKNISLDQAGSYTWSATTPASTPASTGAGSIPLTVTPAAVRHFTFTTNPALTISSGTTFSVALILSDKFGNTLISDDSIIALTLAGGSSATLDGDTTEAATAGIADFSGLSVSQPGFYRIIATDQADNVQATSSSFRITAASHSTGST